VCTHFAEAMRRHGVPQEILTDNGKVFTGRFGLRETEVLFDRICRENGIDHLLTAPRSPTTTGKIERFHRTLRSEFLTGRVFADMGSAQAELDASGTATSPLMRTLGVVAPDPRRRPPRRPHDAGGVWFRLMRDTSAPADGLRGSGCWVTPAPPDPLRGSA
jgi:transposase InsO family protein